MTITPGLLAAAVHAVCPIDGIAGPIVPPSPWTLYPASDGSEWRIDFRADATSAQQQAAIQALAGYVDPAPVRTAVLSVLLDPLSAAQRASITADHMLRLQAEAADHPGGLPIGNAKVTRAAADMGLTPDAWFKLAGA